MCVVTLHTGKLVVSTVVAPVHNSTPHARRDTIIMARPRNFLHTMPLVCYILALEVSQYETKHTPEQDMLNYDCIYLSAQYWMRVYRCNMNFRSPYSRSLALTRTHPHHDHLTKLSLPKKMLRRPTRALIFAEETFLGGLAVSRDGLVPLVSFASFV